MKLIACVECGAPVIKRGNTRYCADCARRIRRRRHADRQRLRRAANRRAAAPSDPPPTIDKCDRPTARAARQPKGVDFLLEDAAGNVYHVRAYLIRRVPADVRAAVLFRLRGMIALAQQIPASDP